MADNSLDQLFDVYTGLSISKTPSVNQPPTLQHQQHQQRYPDVQQSASGHSSAVQDRSVGQKKRKQRSLDPVHEEVRAHQLRAADGSSKSEASPILKKEPNVPKRSKTTGGSRKSKSKSRSSSVAEQAPRPVPIKISKRYTWSDSLHREFMGTIFDIGESCSSTICAAM
jgi:hypothetical protein